MTLKEIWESQGRKFGWRAVSSFASSKYWFEPIAISPNEENFVGFNYGGSPEILSACGNVNWQICKPEPQVVEFECTWSLYKDYFYPENISRGLMAKLEGKIWKVVCTEIVEEK